MLGSSYALPIAIFAMGFAWTLGVAAAVAVARAAAAPSTTFSQPFRGFNPWFAFDVHLNETVMRENADALVSLG